MSDPQMHAETARAHAERQLADVRARGQLIREWADYWRRIRAENHFIEKLDRALKGHA